MNIYFTDSFVTDSNWGKFSHRKAISESSRKVCSTMGLALYKKGNTHNFFHRSKDFMFWSDVGPVEHLEHFSEHEKRAYQGEEWFWFWYFYLGAIVGECSCTY